MDDYDDDDWYGYDDDRRAAYERAVGDFIYDDFVLGGDYDESADGDADIYAEFANIVQQYDRVARPDHDDIDFDPASLDDNDGVEYDHNGDIVITYGVILGVLDAIIDFGSFADIPDDFEFAEDDPAFPIPDISGRFRFPLYNPRRPACKRRRGVHFYNPRPDTPPV